MNVDKKSSTLAQMNNAASVHHCLTVLKSQFNNVYDYDVNNAKLENTVLFSETVRQNITSIVSITNV